MKLYNTLSSYLLNIKTRVKINDLKMALIVSAITGLMASVEQLAIYTPIVISLYICFKYYNYTRNKHLIILYPFLLFLDFFFSGGAIFLIDYTTMEKTRLIIMGIFGVSMALLMTKLFFKIKITFNHFIAIALLVSVPYLLGLNPTKESQNSLFLFHTLFNFGLLSVIAYIFTSSDSTDQYKKRQDDELNWF